MPEGMLRKLVKTGPNSRSAINLLRMDTEIVFSLGYISTFSHHQIIHDMANKLVKVQFNRTPCTVQIVATIQADTQLL